MYVLGVKGENKEKVDGSGMWNACLVFVIRDP